MDYKFVASRQLRCLLNDAEKKQKQDIYEYTAGHLNSNKLRQPPAVLAEQRGWQPDYTSSLTVLPKSNNKTYATKISKDSNEMKDALYQFSISTSGSVPNIKGKLGPPKKLLYLRESTSPKADQEKNSKYIPDGVLVEELDHNVCLPSPKYQKKPNEDKTTVLESTTTGQQLPRSPSYDPLAFNQSFYPGLVYGVTKRDQFCTLKSFESKVVRKQDSCEGKALSGYQVVEQHKRNLDKNLSKLNTKTDGPNFHKLQLYSQCFEDITDSGSGLKLVLKDIKLAYDDYIAALLDKQGSKSQLLQDQIEQISSKGTYKPLDVELVRIKQEELEKEVEWLLEENQRLKECVQDEADALALTPEQEPVIVPKRNSYLDEGTPELAEELEHYKALILEKLDALQAFRTKLREDHVPQNVCTHLEQCIKETEIEVQKLLKQNEYFERSIGDMEHSLKEAIIDADTSEKDAKRIWRKVNSSKSQLDSDDEDESKWNWYIS